MKFISAKEAREQVNSLEKESSKKQMDKVMEQIKSAVDKEQNSITLYFILKPSVNKKLKDLGYIVSVYNGMSYRNDEPSTTITW